MNGDRPRETVRMKIQAEWGRASGPYRALSTAENSSFAASLASSRKEIERERENEKKKPSIERDERKKEK